jgi:hypothetical protein
MEGFDTDRGSFDATLEQRPDVFDAISVYIPPHIRFRVIYELVYSSAPLSTCCRTWACRVFRLRFLRWVTRTLLVLRSSKPDNQFLADSTSALNLFGLLLFVHETGESADKVSSASTGPAPPILSKPSRGMALRIRWSMNQAVCWVTFRSRAAS